MKTKLVIWGTNAQDEKILVGLELRIADNKVNLYTFPEAVATDEFVKTMMDDWRNNKEVDLPAEHTVVERDLSLTEGLLPEDIKVERGDLVQRAQMEWHFIVLSSKLSESYKAELEELSDRINQLTKFDSELWENLKSFWDRVQNQVRERNLFRDHADQLRDGTNELFAKMKSLRSRLDEEFRDLSKGNMERFNEMLQDIEERIEKSGHLSKAFEELKVMQRKFRDTKFTREHRNKIWSKLDGAFKKVKEKRFGEKASDDHSPLERLNRRYQGLLNAINKMERSIRRDEEDLAFQDRQIERTDGQLEAQIRQAKIKMIEQRVDSKREKLAEMLSTKKQLEDRKVKMEAREAERQAKQQEREMRKEARSAMKDKIAEEIKSREESLSPADQEKLEKAAQALAGNERQPAAAVDNSPEAILNKAAEAEAKETLSDEAATDEAPGAEKENLISAAGTALTESLEDVVDTIKAVAEVVGGKVEDTVADMKEKVEEKKAQAADARQKEAKQQTAVPTEDAPEEKASLLDSATHMLDEVVTNVKAVAEVVADKIDEVVDDLGEKVDDFMEEE